MKNKICHFHFFKTKGN